MSEYNSKTNQFIAHLPNGKETGMSDFSVNCVLEDSHGDLWMATNDGLNYLNRKNNRFTVYFRKDGLSGTGTQGILEDGKGNLWITTNNGLSKFDPKTRAFQTFGVTDGLQSNEFSRAFWKSRTGTMYVGGNNGFNEFFSRQCQKNSK